MPRTIAPPRGIFVPPEQVETYLCNGWSIVDGASPCAVLMAPPAILSQGGVSRETRSKEVAP